MQCCESKPMDAIEQPIWDNVAQALHYEATLFEAMIQKHKPMRPRWAPGWLYDWWVRRWVRRHVVVEEQMVGTTAGVRRLLIDGRVVLVLRPPRYRLPEGTVIFR